MLKNYFKIAWRNILRNRMRSFIHILGLSIGIAICFLIFNLVVHSYGFDRFHPDLERIYRVTTVSTWGTESYPNSGTPGPLGEVIQEEVSGIEDKARLYTLGHTMVANPTQNKVYGRIDGVTFSDLGFFRIFPRKWLAGNPETALVEPNTAVISESSLNRYFPGSDPDAVLGQELLWVDADSIYARVTGVVEDFGGKSDFIFKDFISFSTIKSKEKEDWYGLHNWSNVNSSSQLFVKTATETKSDQVNLALEQIVAKNYDSKEEGSTTFLLEHLGELHFTQNYTNTTVSRVFLQGLIYIGLIILVLASLNFINLETAQAIGRAKEVGIRKTIGGTRVQLVSQFLAETLLLVVFSTFLAMGMVELIRVMFSSYLPTDFGIDHFAAENLLFYLSFPLLVSLVTGIYPSLVLSGYQPQRALKGEMATRRGFSFGGFMRKNLTVLQFTASIAFIILVLVLNYQLKYVTSQPMGFENEAVMYTRLPFMSDPGKMLQLQNRLNQETLVKGASLSGSLVSSSSLWTSDAKVAQDTSETTLGIQVMNVDSAFVRVNGIPLLAGTAAIDHQEEILVNENFLKEAGIDSPEEAIGLAVHFSGEPRKIIGVIGNFHSRTLREEIRPMLLMTNPPYFQTATVKLAADQNLAMAREKLEQIYLSIYPNEEASFQFLDTEIERFYSEDVKIRNVLGFACGLAILISCMGLFGLSSFTIAQRTKEISIRKVLGASILQILGLISKEYLVLVLVSFSLAVYPAYYFLRDWLNGFNTRVEMPYLIFVAAGLGVMLLCLLIVGLHSYAAAQTNPAKVLKSE